MKHNCIVCWVCHVCIAVSANVIHRREAEQEREALLQQLAENKRLDAEQLVKLRQDIAAHRSDLLGQIDYNRRRREVHANEEKRLEARQQEAEIEYQRKIEYLLNKPVIEKIHPMRRHLYMSAGHERRTATQHRGVSSAHTMFG